MVVIINFREQHFVAAFRAVKRGVAKRYKDGLRHFIKLCRILSRIKTVIKGHFEVFLRDMLD